AAPASVSCISCFVAHELASNGRTDAVGADKQPAPFNRRLGGLGRARLGVNGRVSVLQLHIHVIFSDSVACAAGIEPHRAWWQLFIQRLLQFGAMKSHQVSYRLEFIGWRCLNEPATV